MNSRIIKEVYDFTIKQMSLGAGNVRKPSEKEKTYNQRQDKISLFRAVAVDLLDRAGEAPAYKNLSPLESDFLITFLDSINALHNKAGNCCEFAALTFVNFLKQQIDCPIEIIFISDPNSKEVHDFVVLGRSNHSTLEKLYTWKNVTIVDAWPGAIQPLKFYSENETPRIKDLLTPGIESIDCLIPRARSEKLLTPQQWLKYADFLAECRKHVTPELLSKFALAKEMDIDIKSECNGYLKTMDKEISTFRAKAFMIQHWKNPTLTYPSELFRPKLPKSSMPNDISRLGIYTQPNSSF